MNATSQVALVAIDVDGTLANSHNQVDADTIGAVRTLLRSGAVVVIASSRSPVGIHHLLADLDNEDLWICAFQGALVGKRNKDGRIVRVLEYALSGRAADEVVGLALDAGFSVGRYYEQQWRVNEISQEIAREATLTGETAMVDNRIAVRGEPAHKILVVAASSDVARLVDFKAALPAGVSAVFSHPNYLEVSHPIADKGLGVTAIADQLGIDRRLTAAIGDAENDLGMMRAVGISVAMGNAHPAVKAACTMVTADNDNNGVAAAIGELVSLWGLVLPEGSGDVSN